VTGRLPIRILQRSVLRIRPGKNRDFYLTGIVNPFNPPVAGVQQILKDAR
jgi:hypothetical protein